MAHSVLIVDDEPGITVALMTRLQASGYTVYHAINGLAGVEAAALHEPDAIIMDIRMPDIDGIEACQRIKRLPRLAETPVVFLSANVQEEPRRQAMAVGASAFISKPYEAQQVIDTIAEIVGAATPPEHAETPDGPGPSDAPGDRATVLVIDDEVGMTAALRTRLGAMGYRILTAHSGEDGLDRFRSHSVDLVLTDLHMPGGSGIDVARAVREASDTPIVVMTGHKAEYRRELRDISNVIELQKPCETAQLIEVIEGALALGGRCNRAA